MAQVNPTSSSQEILSEATFSAPDLLRAIRTEEGKKLGNSLKGKVMIDSSFLKAFHNNVVLSALQVIEKSRDLIESWPESFQLKISVTTYDSDYSCSHTINTSLSYKDSEGNNQTVKDTISRDQFKEDLCERILLISRLAALL